MFSKRLSIQKSLSKATIDSDFDNDREEEFEFDSRWVLDHSANGLDQENSQVDLLEDDFRSDAMFTSFCATSIIFFESIHTIYTNYSHFARAFPSLISNIANLSSSQSCLPFRIFNYSVSQESTDLEPI